MPAREPKIEAKHDWRGAPPSDILPVAEKGEPGFVYFLQAGEDGPIKIGWTYDVAARIDALQTACPFPLVLRGLVEGDQQFERSLHRRFSEYRMRGEWFRDCEEMHAMVRSSAPPPDPWQRRARKGKTCINCQSFAALRSDGLCRACWEFQDARESDCDPFDPSISRV